MNTLYHAEYKSGAVIHSSELIDIAWTLKQLRKLYTCWRIVRIGDSVVIAQSREWKK
jgi:hypothetical protein